MDAENARESERLFEFGNRYLVGGVSAAARINAALGRPLYLVRGDGCRLYDVDGREFYDYALSHGATFLGHNHPAIRQAVEEALDCGVICAYETAHQSRLAERLCRVIPCAEQVRFANTGSEATQLAIRLARGATGRSKILKFEGHFHGLHDALMWNFRSLVQEANSSYPYVPARPESSGLSSHLAEDLVIVPWNDRAAVEQAMREQGAEVAAILCEPVNYNSGCIPPRPGFLAFLREQASQHGSVLIFDEVLTAFRMARGGAQEYYGVTPDLCTVAKAVANGLPLAVLAGRKAVMQRLSPLGPVSHSGTYTGNLIPVLAALACLEEIDRNGFYEELHAKAARLYGGLMEIFEAARLPVRVQGVGARFSIYFGFQHEVWSSQEAVDVNPALAQKFVRGCFDRGVYFSCGRQGLGHVGFCAAHTLADIDETLARVEAVAKTM